MSKRMNRVNELLRRELSEHLRQRYRSRAVSITISDVVTSPDLRKASIYYSVLGDSGSVEEAATFLNRVKKELRQHIGRQITLKYLPELEFFHDPSMERGAHILDLLDSLNANENSHKNEN